MKLARANKLNKSKVAELYSKIIVSVMELIVLRYKQDIDYGWVDTKLNLLTGEDYSDEDIFRGKNTVYGWIQGRALQSLTYHAKWLENNTDNKKLVEDIKEILRKVLAHLEYAKEINGGHLFFFMDREGRAFNANNYGKIDFLTPDELTCFNFSDLFSSKGMYITAKYLGLKAAEKEAKQYCNDVLNAVWRGNFASDQFSFRGNITSATAVLNSIGPYMLLLDTADMMLEDEPCKVVDIANRLMERILSNHICLNGKWQFGEEYDCIENVEIDGQPTMIDGVAESDPGHSIEFTGLALKFIFNSKKYDIPGQARIVPRRYSDLLINILKKNFHNGYSEGSGISKGFDLISRCVIDKDMPWWSLPETMRAVLYAMAIEQDEKSYAELAGIFRECHNCFVNNYLRPELNYLSIQNINPDNGAGDRIPATPDVDPGYHTGICLIDCMEIMRKYDISLER